MVKAGLAVPLSDLTGSDMVYVQVDGIRQSSKMEFRGRRRDVSGRAGFSG